MRLVRSCLLTHEDGQTLDIPEELAIALAKKSSEGIISLLLKESRNLEVTANLPAAGASNSFHVDAVLSVLLTRCPKLYLHQSASILKAAVGNQEFGVRMLETVLKCMPPDSPQTIIAFLLKQQGIPSMEKSSSNDLSFYSRLIGSSLSPQKSSKLCPKISIFLDFISPYE
jgi:hypothetical protein